MSLEIIDLSVVFHRAGRQPVPAVVNVNLRVDPGRLVGLVGESGSGKSSLGRATVGIYKPTAGRVMFNGEPVQVLRARARPKSQTALQMVFQNPFEFVEPAQAHREPDPRWDQGIRDEPKRRRPSAPRA